MPKALVIGSAGNVGKPLVAHLKCKGWDVSEVDIKQGFRDGYTTADINDPVDLMPSFSWYPNVVFHLAGMVSRVTCEQSPSVAARTNLAGLQNVISMCQSCGARLIYFSTSEVYGNHGGTLSEDSMCEPNNFYGLTKYLGEALVEYATQGGLNAVTLRPFMIYDELEQHGDHRSAMIRFATELSAGRPITVHRGAMRGWLHISDAVELIERAGSMIMSGHEVINIGSNEVVPIECLASLMVDLLGVHESLVTYEDMPDKMTLTKRPDLTRQKRLLGWSPKVTLAEGVLRVVEEAKKCCM